MQSICKSNDGNQERDRAMAEEVRETIGKQTANVSTGGSGRLWLYVLKCANTAATAATLSFTTAEAERLFAKLEETVTAIRSTMDEKRLEACLMLQIHRAHTSTL